MRYQLAVLDMAGTTVFDGDAVNTCLRRSLRRVAGLEVTRDAANGVMGLPKPVAISRLLDQAQAIPPTNARVSEVLEDFERQMLDYYHADPAVREVEGATEAFEQLRAAGIRVGLDTGFSRRIADAVLHRLGWVGPDWVDATIASDEVAAGRPAPDMIFRLMERCDVSSPAAVAKVGDTPADLLEGAAAGCAAIVGVLSGSHTANELAQYPHTALIPSIRQLPALLTAAQVHTRSPDSLQSNHAFLNRS